jgi:hypothetical protein
MVDVCGGCVWLYVVVCGCVSWLRGGGVWMCVAEGVWMCVVAVCG